MPFDPSKIQIRILAVTNGVTGGGQTLDVTDLCSACSISEDLDGVAARCTIELRVTENVRPKIPSMFPLGNGLVIVEAIIDSATIRMFLGIVFRRDGEDSGADATVEITAFDPLIYLQKSEDDFVAYRRTGGQIITALADKWRIIRGEILGPNIKLSRKVYRGKSLGQIILDCLAETRLLAPALSQEWWYARYENGITVRKCGSNAEAVIIEKAELVGVDRNIDDVVTQVKIYAQTDTDDPDELPASAFPLITIPSDFQASHTLQKVMYQDRENPGNEKVKAKRLIKEKGKPRLRASLRTVLLPALRKGDRVEINMPPILTLPNESSGLVIARGVTHDLLNKKTTVEIELQNV